VLVPHFGPGNKTASAGPFYRLFGSDVDVNAGDAPFSWVRYMEEVPEAKVAEEHFALS